MIAFPLTDWTDYSPARLANELRGRFCEPERVRAVSTLGHLVRPSRSFYVTIRSAATGHGGWQAGITRGLWDYVGWRITCAAYCNGMYVYALGENGI